MKKRKKTKLSPTNFLLGEKAFSIIQVIIAMSILTVMGYLTTDMIVNQQKSISNSEARMESIEIFRQVQTLLSDKDSCKRTLAGDSNANPPIPGVRLWIIKGTDGTYRELGMLKKDQAIQDRAGNIVFKTGGIYGNGALKVTKIAVRNKSLEVKSGDTTGSGRATLHFSTERLKGSLKGKTTTRNFLLQVVAETDGYPNPVLANITECYVKEEEEKGDNTDIMAEALRRACLMLGAQYEDDSGCHAPKDADIECEQDGFNCYEKRNGTPYRCNSFGAKTCSSGTTLENISKPSLIFSPRLAFGCGSSKKCKDYIQSMPDYLSITKDWLIGSGSPLPSFFLGQRGKVTKRPSGGFNLDLQFVPEEEYEKYNAMILQYKTDSGLTVSANINLNNYNQSKKKFTQKRYTTACCRSGAAESLRVGYENYRQNEKRICDMLGGLYNEENLECQTRFETDIACETLGPSSQCTEGGQAGRSISCNNFGATTCSSPGRTLKKVSKLSTMFFPSLDFGCYSTKECKDYIKSMGFVA